MLLYKHILANTSDTANRWYGDMIEKVHTVNEPVKLFQVCANSLLKSS